MWGVKKVTLIGKVIAERLRGVTISTVASKRMIGTREVSQVKETRSEEREQQPAEIFQCLAQRPDRECRKVSGGETNQWGSEKAQ